MAALLVDEVFPDVPLRQWVISLPFPLRYLFATHRQAMGKVLGVVYRAVSIHLIRLADQSARRPLPGTTRLTGTGHRERPSGVSRTAAEGQPDQIPRRPCTEPSLARTGHSSNARQRAKGHRQHRGQVTHRASRSHEVGTTPETRIQ